MKAMAKRNNAHSIPAFKIVATSVGVALCIAETWLNAEHVAKTEGWISSLVLVVIVASFGAASALPLAERALKSGQTAKTFGLAIFFAMMVAFSFGASIERVGGKRDNDTSAVRNDNKQAALAQEAYDAAQKTAKAECDKARGTKCRDAEKAVTKARSALVSAPAERTEDSMGLRVAALLPFLTPQQVALYQPLALPIALQLGGFIMLALGLAPRTPEEAKPKRKAAAKRPKKTPRPPKTMVAAANDDQQKVVPIKAARAKRTRIAA
jgi:hypothetical protein